MTFEEVLPALKAGKKVQRLGWDSNTYLYVAEYEHESEWVRPGPAIWYTRKSHPVYCFPEMPVKYEARLFSGGCQALLAEDWVIMEEEEHEANH